MAEKDVMGFYPHSGKCDFADHLAIYTNGEPTDEDFKKMEIYVGYAGPLRIDTFADAIPYFPYLTSCAASFEGHHSITLGTKSYIDQEEENHRSWYERDVLAYLKKCKREKTEPSYEDFLKKYYIGDCFQVQEIYKRISTNPKDYYLGDIHFNLHHWYREMLLEYAEKHGCNMNHPIFQKYRWEINDYNKLYQEYSREEKEKKE